MEQDLVKFRNHRFLTTFYFYIHRTRCDSNRMLIIFCDDICFVRLKPRFNQCCLVNTRLRLKSSYQWRIWDGKWGRNPHLSPNYFIFLQFWAKIMPNNRLVPPLWGCRPQEILDPPLLFCSKSYILLKHLLLYGHSCERNSGGKFDV